MSERIFNAEMLTLARESRGLTQASLAKRLRVTQSEISKIENRMREPDKGRISNFSRELGYTEDFFYLGEAIRGPGSGCVYNRRRQSLPQGQLREIIAKVNVRRIQVKSYLKAAALDAENRFVKRDAEDESPAEIAQIFRRYWALPSGPIQSIVRTIEDAGGIVISTNFSTRKVDAISQLAPGIPPLFFLNSASPADRLRFTLAHEIGHIVMHDGPTEAMEKEADLFAAEFLMPAAEIRPRLREITLPKLATLKPYWKVSMSALLMRADDLGLISPRRKSYFWMEMGKSGWRRKEPIDIPHEESTLFEELISFHRNDLGYSDQDLAKASYWTGVSELRSVLPRRLAGRNGLRLVK